MAIISEQYSQEKVDQIGNLLTRQQEKGNPRDYEIFVDTLKVVDRTDEAEEFDSFSDFVTGDTKSITIVMYHGQSNRNDKYIFRLKESEASLNGPTLDTRIDDKLAGERQKWEFELLQDEKRKLQRELKEAQEYIEELENGVDQLKSRKFHLGNINLGELGSVMLESFIRRNPHVLNNLPGGSELAGVLDSPAPEATEEHPTEVSVAAGPSDPQLNYGLQLLEALQQRYDQQGFAALLTLLENLNQSPELISQLLPILSDERTDNPINDTLNMNDHE